MLAINFLPKFEIWLHYLPAMALFCYLCDWYECIHPFYGFLENSLNSFLTSWLWRDSYDISANLSHLSCEKTDAGKKYSLSRLESFYAHIKSKGL